MGEEIGHAHDAGELGEEDQPDPEGAGPDGVAGKLLLASPRTRQEMIRKIRQIAAVNNQKIVPMVIKNTPPLKIREGAAVSDTDIPVRNARTFPTLTRLAVGFGEGSLLSRLCEFTPKLVLPLSEL